MPRRDLIRLRRGTAADWSAINPVLALAEPGIERDTGRVKIGDGTTSFNDLAYSTPAMFLAAVSNLDDQTTGTIGQTLSPLPAVGTPALLTDACDRNDVNARLVTISDNFASLNAKVDTLIDRFRTSDLVTT